MDQLNLSQNEERFQKENSNISETHDHSNIFQDSHFSAINSSLAQLSLQKDPIDTKSKESFAMMIAKRFPKNISEQVCKMIEYYEYHSKQNLERIHSLTQENTKLRKKIGFEQGDKENHERKYNTNTSNRMKSEENQMKISILQDNSLAKDQKINELNQQITTLLMKVKKYKKRVYELQEKSSLNNEHDI